MFHELTLSAPSNMVTLNQVSIASIRTVGFAIKCSAAAKSFFSIERCFKIIATAAILDVVILLFVLNSLVGISIGQIFSI